MNPVLGVALLLAFSPPIGELTEIHITRSTTEPGRQLVDVTVTDPNGVTLDCSCAHMSPSQEVYSFVPTNSGEYTVALEGTNTSLTAEIFVIPKLTIADTEVQYYAHPDYYYTVQRNRRFPDHSRWRRIDRDREQEQGDGWITQPISTSRDQVMYRVLVER